MESVSRLDYIMKVLNISGKEIANKLNVDKATVSKWRNNQRKLNYKSKYTKQIAELILSNEVEQKRHIVVKILKAYKEDLNWESLEQQKDNLCLWLTEDKLEMNVCQAKHSPLYSPRNGYNTSVSIFLGDKGIDEAIEYFMEYLLKIPTGKTMYLIDYSGINWINGDESTDNQTRINTCMELFERVLEYGHKFIIVDCDTDMYRPYKAIFRWMKLYLMEGVEVWTHLQMSEEQNHYTTFAVKNEIALQCISNDYLPSEHHCTLYKNKETTDFLSNSAEAILRKSKKLIKSVSTNDLITMSNVMNKYLKPRQHIYMLNPSLTLQGLNEELLLDILTENDADNEKINNCLLVNRKIKEIKQKCRYISIYDLDVIEKLMMQDKIIDYNLSEICGKEIMISKKNWLKIIDSIMQLDNNENYSSTLTSFSYLNIVPENLSILVQEDSFVAAWDVKKYKKRMYCVNLDVISGFYRYMDDIWHMIPKVCKTITWRNKQLMRLLENK